MVGIVFEVVFVFENIPVLLGLDVVGLRGDSSLTMLILESGEGRS